MSIENTLRQIRHGTSPHSPVSAVAEVYDAGRQRDAMIAKGEQPGFRTDYGEYGFGTIRTPDIKDDYLGRELIELASAGFRHPETFARAHIYEQLLYGALTQVSTETLSIGKWPRRKAVTRPIVAPITFGQLRRTSETTPVHAITYQTRTRGTALEDIHRTSDFRVGINQLRVTLLGPEEAVLAIHRELNTEMATSPIVARSFARAVFQFMLAYPAERSDAHVFPDYTRLPDPTYLQVAPLATSADPESGKKYKIPQPS